MTRKPKKRNTHRSKPAAARQPTRRKPAKRTTPAANDPLDTFIAAALRALDLPANKAWLPAIKANLRVTLQLGKTVADFKLPDSAEPAPTFRA